MKIFNETYKNLELAEKTIPLGSQTFSKSKIQFPGREAPLFAKRGIGGRLIDVDDNEYVDLICGLLPVNLGYCDADVDNAIRHQLDNGISFSLSSPLERELSELLVEVIPSAEMVRFGKTGSDATSGAVRLARAFTKRDKVISIGYHGWQDWYIGATSRNKGVPKSVREQTIIAPYNDLEALSAIFTQNKNEISCVIMEPMNVQEPHPGYLETVKSIVHQNGALLIFDEVITGFRFSLGGAQEYFNVQPDLTALGKGLGNGMPISAVVGKAEIMKEMENIFFSGTFGGETLSIVAAITVINKLRTKPVIKTIWENGQRLSDGVNKIIENYDMGKIIKLNGLAPWKILSFEAYKHFTVNDIKTFFMHQMINNGVLIQASHNICFAHTDEDINVVLKAYDKTLAKMSKGIEYGNKNLASVPLIKPVFTVR